ncbi:MAG: DNA mismatch repair endonuclease MutL [Bacteroidales bacterium]|nr:DNA mismatch repair endonuclease MutL [Bacteroidales bacterium]
MINVLPGNIANLIAAGEVVNRPASALKELMENSIDAGADNISVVVEDSGRTSIRVIDNGSGMSPEDAQLCFERHATSKISSAEDLERIITYGFRGEALASIAAVSRVILRTRREEDEVGFEVHCSESKITSAEPASTPKGCSIEVRDLFYNTPARRKFLKSDAAELRHLVQEFSRVAIVHPEIAFTFLHNGKTLYSLRPVGNEKQRIVDFAGVGLSKELVDIEVDTSMVKIRGFVGAPAEARKVQGNQYFFVNGRYFRSPYLHKAVCKPYEHLLKDGFSPSYFIFFEVDPSAVDVNIHPAKTEVKFEDEPMIFEILSVTVRKALGQNAFTPSLDFDQVPSVEFPSLSKDAPRYTAPPKIDYDPLFDPFEMERRAPADIPVPAHPGTAAAEREVMPFGSRYIAVPVEEGLMVIDVPRARERILYEEYFPLLAEKHPVTEQSLYPLTMDLSPEDHELALDNADLFARLGFDLRDLGQNSIVLYGLPAGMNPDRKGVEEAVAAIIDDIRQGKLGDDAARDAAILAHSVACADSGSIDRAGAQLLVRQLLGCRQPDTAPAGGRTFTILTDEDLEKKL